MRATGENRDVGCLRAERGGKKRVGLKQSHSRMLGKGKIKTQIMFNLYHIFRVIKSKTVRDTDYGRH